MLQSLQCLSQISTNYASISSVSYLTRANESLVINNVIIATDCESKASYNSHLSQGSACLQYLVRLPTDGKCIYSVNNHVQRSRKAETSRLFCLLSLMYTAHCQTADAGTDLSCAVVTLCSLPFAAVLMHRVSGLV